MCEPSLVMLDEPMAGVNPALTQSLLDHVKSLRDEGRTVIFVEHDMDVVYDISDWVVVMAEGAVISEGRPESIGRDPAVIDAYLGRHHDAPLDPEEEAEFLAEDEAEIEREGRNRRPPRPPRPATTSRRLAGRTSNERSGREPLIRVDEVVAGYVPGVNILNGCSLELAPGELVGIIGPNGAGKSTLLKALFGLIPIREGGVTFKGEDIAALPAHALVSRGIGYVPQNNNVFPSLTIRENLEMGSYLQPKRVPEQLERVVGMFPRLGERLKQRAGSLSGGERQMLAMGRALMMDPEVLLLDEPSAGLSPALQDQVFIRARQINRAGVSIVMVEQNARRCLQICHRGYVLDQGRNAYTDTGRALLEDPKVIELYLGTLARVR